MATSDVTNLDQYFPFESYREKQRAVLEAAATALFEEDYDYLVIDAPTGVGKSAINVALARMVDSAFYCTPQKKLREQLQADSVLGDYYQTLRGRADYSCGVTGADCKQCSINRSNDESCKKYDDCTYWSAKEHAMLGDIAVLTFAYLITDRNIPANNKQGERVGFGNRDLMIVDECHNLEDQAASLFAGFEVSPWALPDEVYEGLLGHVGWEAETHADVYPVLEELEERCKTFRTEYSESERGREFEQVKNKLSQLRWFFREVDDLDRTWVVNMDSTKYNGNNRKSMELKPVLVDNFLQHHIWSRADKCVLSSATIPFRGNVSQWLDRIGIGDRAHVLKVGMPFPKQNRPIHTHTEIGSMSSGGVEEHWNEIMATLNRLSGRHAGENGLVHTASYDRAESVYDAAGDYDNLQGNVLFHTGNEDSETFLERWQDSSKDIVVTPSMTEGVDLAGDKCRWQVLLKVPYPSPGDSRVGYLLDEAKDWTWYKNTTATDIIQSVGRAVRSKDDYADYYVLDEKFESLRNDSSVEFPAWFSEAIVDDPAVAAGEQTDGLAW